MVVSIFAVSVGAVIDKEIKFSDTLLLAASSVTTATSSCFILGNVFKMKILKYFHKNKEARHVTNLWAKFEKVCLN